MIDAHVVAERLGRSRPSHARVASTLGTSVVLLLLLPITAMAQHVQRYDNGRWYDGTTFVEHTMFVVDGIFQTSFDGEPSGVIDLNGAFVVPPYGDAHSHALAGPRFEPDNDAFLSTGVFYVGNPNNVLRWTRQSRIKAAQPQTVDVRYANGGLTSAGGHPTQIDSSLPQQVEGLSADDLDGEAYFTIDDRAELVARWPEILAGKPDFLKIYLETSEKHAERRNDPEFVGKRGLDPSLVAPIVEKAHAADLRVSAHITSAFDFRTAVEAGVDELAHLPLSPLTDADAELAAATGVVIVTTVVSHRPTHGIADVRALHRDNILLLKKHGVRLVLGTDSDQTVIDESRQLYDMGVYSAEEIVRLLTVDTPRYLFSDRRIGRLANDYEASFLALESNPLEDLDALSQIKLRVKAGHLLEIEASKGLPSIGQTIANTIMHEGIEAGIEQYHRLRREQPNDYDFTEPQLNALGYALLQHGRVEDAIAVFELNAEMFPNSANCYDSLGEAYMIFGNKEKAIASYQRSLELDPNNQNAVKKLEELEEGADG